MHIAMIKKEAVLALPTAFQVSDPKINPNAKHMVWASILLEDTELFAITTSIFITELSRKHAEYSEQDYQQVVDKLVFELTKIPNNSSTQKNILSMLEIFQE
jgi:hypothetical protein